MYLKKNVEQFVKFGIVGAINTFSSTLILYFLLYIRVEYLLATTIAFCLVTVIGFMLNKKWVFKSTLNKKTVFIKYVITYGLSLSINLLCMYIWVDALNISQYIAPIMTLFITVPINFILSRLWVFKGKEVKNNG